MPIDARIALMGQPLQLRDFDPVKSMQAAAQLKAAQYDARLSDLKYGEVERDISEQRSLRDAFRSSMTVDPQTGEPTLNKNQFLSTYGQIAPEKAWTMRQQMEKSQVEKQKADAETQEKQIPLINQGAWAVLQADDRGEDAQAVYTSVLANLARAGVPVNHLSKTYNRASVQQFFDESLPLVQRIQQQKQAQEALQFTQTQATTQRGQDLSAQSAQAGHQVTTRGQDLSAQTAQAGHGVTMRGQDMTAQTAREGHQATDQRAAQTQAATQSKTQVETEAKLRDDFNQTTRNFREVRDAWGKVQVSTTPPYSQAGDISLIFAYMKMLDPASTVREGEQATVRSAGNIPEQLRGQYNRLVSSEGLMADTVREDFMQRAGMLYQQYEQDYTKTETQYKDITSRSGGNPANVVVDPRTTAPPPAPGPRKASAPASQAPMTREQAIQGIMKRDKVDRKRAEAIVSEYERTRKP